MYSITFIDLKFLDLISELKMACTRHYIISTIVHFTIFVAIILIHLLLYKIATEPIRIL